jgi:hypothetical protein
LVYLYSLTLLLSACLLFFVQPMMGKMILPFLGGAPAVWNTCLVFFQATLLLGYAYAHFSTRWLGVRRQALLHLGLMAVPLFVLPIAVSERALRGLPTDGNPTAWLALCLATVVGLPFFVVSTTAPLLQKWFASSGHRHARNAYFLYAASNAGSMLGLLGYILLLEPTLVLKEQSRLWEWMYGGLALLVIGCAIVLWRSKVVFAGDADVVEQIPFEERAADSLSSLANTVTLRRRLRWVLLAALPSSLMLGVTTYLTTDVAPVPFVLGLAAGTLYLLTFILVFAQRPVYPPSWMRRALCLPAVILTITFIIEAARPGMALRPVESPGVFDSRDDLSCRARQGSTAGKRVFDRVLPLLVSRRSAGWIVQRAGRAADFQKCSGIPARDHSSRVPFNQRPLSPQLAIATMALERPDLGIGRRRGDDGTDRLDPIPRIQSCQARHPVDFRYTRGADRIGS